MNTLIRETTRPLSLAILLILSPVFLIAQIQYGGQPLAKEITFTKEQITAFSKTIALSGEQLATRHQILTEQTPSGQAMQGGFGISVDYNPMQEGNWKNLGDSLWVWMLQIQVEQATGLGLVFENFKLAENAKLFIYGKNTDHFIGSFTHKNNNPQQVFSVQPMAGETITIEYQETIIPGIEKFSGSYFDIREVIYLVQGFVVANDKNLGSSDPCMININCEEGDNWQIQKRGVARLFMRRGNGWFWCSGSLVNNLAYDGKPYLLTADHCGAGASAADLDLWQFSFNYERPECGNNGLPPNNVLFGATMVASAPLDGGSDFKLILLHQPPPLAWRPYYNGWNAYEIPSPSGVGIHHPAGDAKKISTYIGGVVSGGGSFSSGEVMAENSAWRFPFAPTENGHSVTQGGSSGSPMFDNTGLITGTLSGGSSSCSNPDGINIYGKMSYHWASNDSHPSHALSYHLDPKNTGIQLVQGYDPLLPNRPAPGFVSSKLVSDSQVEVNWYKPGQAPNLPGWYMHTRSFFDQNKAIPERANVFEAEALGYSYPATISKISHIFWESTTDSWSNDKFRFRIYASNGFDILYESPVLTAESLVEVIHELETPIIVEGKIYVSVRPVAANGHPSSAYNLTNQGNSFSYTGSAGNWQAVGNNTHQYIYLTGIHVASSLANNKSIEYRNGWEMEQINEPEIDFGTKSQWANLVSSYKVYRNNELIHTHNNEPGANLSYIDAIEDQTVAFIKYHLTAMYGSNESAASNSTYVFLEDQCQDQVTAFPFTEIFDASQHPCWITEGIAGNGWESSQGYTIGDEIEVAPLEGGQFIYVQALEDEEQDEWLISPVFDISELEIPALKFHFNGNYAAANINNESQLNIYVSYSDNTFIKIWDSSDSPLFRIASSHTWIPVTINLKHLDVNGTLRIGFQYTGSNGENFALDKIEIIDASEMIFNLTLNHTPAGSGEVYGADRYIEGEKVSVKAWANTSYFFHFWADASGKKAWWSDYDFVMPGSNYQLTANFTHENVTSTEELTVPEELMVFPNPSQGNISLRTPYTHGNLNIEIINTAGVIVARYLVEQLEAGAEFNMDLSGHPEGLYFISVSTRESREVRKINLVR
ncbi:MAG: T9SS C-terminal target domain-containing protein [Bacteroidetes bacterium]|nr:MAG: T9SS C-terminal target domain-containing protein [Bacteroidota bacterium]